jgi:hypothetical protein
MNSRRFIVQAVARARSKANGSELDAIERLITRLVAIYPEEGFDQPSLWPLCAKLTPHVLAPGEGYPDTPKIAEWGLLVAHAAGYWHRRAGFLPSGEFSRSERRRSAAPLHSITSSARASSVGGMSSPSALAVLTLITSSNFVDRWIGRSPGFSPLRMRAA